jgi:hypothetical protein
METHAGMAHPLGPDRLATVLEEMNAIHLANIRYWGQKRRNGADDMAFERRLERLEQIRKECGWIEPPPED